MGVLALFACTNPTTGADRPGSASTSGGTQGTDAPEASAATGSDGSTLGSSGATTGTAGADSSTGSTTTGVETPCFDGVPGKPAPLAPLPSCAGPHIDAIAALGEGEWLNIGVPEPGPELGRARGRSWTARMPPADDLGGAFLYGEGAHGWWNQETGLFMDDLWFYDLMAHRWISLYPKSCRTCGT